MAGSPFCTPKLTRSYTPGGKAARLAKLLVHQSGKLNPGGSCSPAGQKATAAVPQVLPANASAGGCQPLKAPASHGSASSRPLSCTAQEDAWLHGELASSCTSNFSCTGSRKMARGAAP